MARWKKRKPGDSNQLQIDWSARPSAAEGGRTTAAPSVTGNVAESSSPAARRHNPDLVQVLQWDFVTTFPEPLPEAIEAGTIAEEDAQPENLKSLHDEMARQLLKVLTELDDISGAKRRGVDPKTQVKPTSRGGKERLKKYLDEEPARLERNWQAIIGVHESAFGNEAADAFGKAIRARHAGIDVVKQSGPPAPVTMPTAIESTRVGPVADKSRPGQERRRIIARLPVPHPLPAAVAAGHFGQDDDGINVRPGPGEVRAITEQHAEHLIELLHGRDESQFQNGIAMYAEDFGQRPAEQLEAYTRRQARERSR